jgi:hypothetical protein
MKVPLDTRLLPRDALLITCSSHERRCQGLVRKLGKWHPSRCVVFHYDDKNPKREVLHAEILTKLKAVHTSTQELTFTERSAAESLRENMERLGQVLAAHGRSPIVLDISVFTRRHLLMLLRWLDDFGFWGQLSVVYTEPEDYDVSEYIPLSFGLHSLEQIPGFPACPDLSRPVHLVLFLGFEGDRALAVYEHIEPMQTTLIITDPPYNAHWLGRAERLNRNLLALVKHKDLVKVNGIDPDDSMLELTRVFGDKHNRSAFAKVVCPIGTKPQSFGVYCYVRDCDDPPAVVYASPLRHNHMFFSHGIGRSWILRLP